MTHSLEEKCLEGFSTREGFSATTMSRSTIPTRGGNDTINAKLDALLIKVDVLAETVDDLVAMMADDYDDEDEDEDNEDDEVVDDEEGEIDAMDEALPTLEVEPVTSNGVDASNPTLLANLKGLTIAELRQRASERSVDLQGATRKADIVDKIYAAITSA